MFRGFSKVQSELDTWLSLVALKSFPRDEQLPAGEPRERVARRSNEHGGSTCLGFRQRTGETAQGESLLIPAV